MICSSDGLDGLGRLLRSGLLLLVFSCDPVPLDLGLPYLHSSE
jgi:hypothetical protein